jgi:hypothetical protein
LGLLIPGYLEEAVKNKPLGEMLVVKADLEPIKLIEWKETSTGRERGHRLLQRKSIGERM